MIYFYVKSPTILICKTLFQCLGNHELDNKVEGLIPFIRNLSCPVLVANLLLDNVPDLKKEPNLYKSIVKNVKGTKIGIIGYLTPDTAFLAPKNQIEYEDEVIALRREVETLKEQEVNIIIALGHSGFIKDLEIARDVNDLDLVIGGHSNTFLWNSNHTSEKPEIPQGLYPTIVKQNSGRTVLVVQAYAYTKYMGSLDLIFDRHGEIIHFTGNPILLDQKIPEDSELLEIIKRYRSDADRANNEVVGTSEVFLDGDKCRLRECNLGNLINDAVLSYTKEHYEKGRNIPISIVQGGRIRSSLNGNKKPFNITIGDYITVLPFTDTLCVMSMNGTVLKRALEHSVASWRTIDTPGQFLQVSGIKVVYDLSRKPGSRVVEAKAICAKCSEMESIQDNYDYNLITSGFISEGGDGYSMFESLPKEIVSYNEVTCVIDYTTKHSPIRPEVSGRITILNEDKVQNIPIINNIQQSSLAWSTRMNVWLLLMCCTYLLIRCLY